MHDFTPLRALAGGVLLGVAASALWLSAGRIAGVSSILGGLFSERGEERAWRAWFLAGLAGGGLVLELVAPSVLGTTGRGVSLTLLAGLLVGFGARLGGGCTSGHGICGLSRLSRRSLVATATFMGAGMITVLASRFLGLAP
jgi:uncharacterized protein